MIKTQRYIPDYAEPIKEVIFTKRYKDINDKINNVLTESMDLSEQFNKTKDIKILVKLRDLDKKRDKLWEKEKRIEKELFG